MSNPQQQSAAVTSRPYQTIDGHVFDASERLWSIPTAAGMVSLNFSNISGASGILCDGIKEACASMLLSIAPERVMKALSAYRVLFRFLSSNSKAPLQELSLADVLRFGESLSKRQRYQLRRLKEQLILWSDTGAYGLSQELRRALPELETETHEVGAAVRTMDPEKGPLTDLEYEGVITSIRQKFAESTIPEADYTLLLLAITLAARPLQLAMLKACDFSESERGDGSVISILQVTRLKQGQGIRPRTLFRPRQLAPAMAELIRRQIAKARNWAASKGIDPESAPIFPSASGHHLAQEFADIGLAGHCSGKNISEKLSRLLDLVTVQSPRTGKPLNLFQTRLRRTFGTRAAAEGINPMVLADLMDHSWVDSSMVYIETRPEMIERIDKAVAIKIAPLAQAFAGTLARRPDIPKGRVIHFPEQQALEQIGECGKFAFCGLAAPLACYTCNYFHPWIDAPHETLLEQLLAERDELLLAADARIAAVAAFGIDLAYDSDSWDITEYLIHSGSRAARTGRVRLNFATRERDGSAPLQEDVTQFAKAFIRTRMSKYSSSALRHSLDAIRTLNGVMLEHGVTEIQEIDATILTKTVETMRPLVSPATVDARSLRIAMMAKFLDENGMSHYPIGGWKPLRYQRSTYGRVGKEFEERRNSKLPSNDVLSALAECFHLAKEDRDVFVSSTTAIMCSAPERINEVLHLSADCIVEQQARLGKPALGLRWPGSKGFSDHIKLVLPAMSDVVRLAIQRLTSISEPARQMAKWYERYPDKIFLPDDLEHLRQKEFLELEEIGVILGLCLENRGNLRRWVKNENLPVTMTKRMPAGHSVMTVSFADFEQVILKRLPTGFPVMDAKTGLHFSDALMVVPEGTFQNGALSSRCMFEPVRYHHITAALGNNSAARSQTIFSRVGLDPDRKMCIRSHQFRHWLNTLTQGENVLQMDIAKWSGRASVQQNSAYDHVTSEEIVIKIREAVGDHAKAIGPLAEIPKNLPVTRAEFAAMTVPTAHVTFYGFCIHDYTSTPCEMFRKCLDCREHVCIKGVPGKTERVRQALETARDNLTNAQQAVVDEVYGADEWVTTHQATVDRLDQLLAILTNPSIADGAVIQLSTSNTYSLSEGALHDHMSLEGSCNLLLPNATPKALQ